MVGIAQLVEQQVVVLEVVGSNPTIYPIMWQIERLQQKNLFTIKHISQTLILIRVFFKQYKTLITHYDVAFQRLYLLFTNNTLKQNYKILYKYNNFKKFKNITTLQIPTLNTSRLFVLYTTLLTHNLNSTHQIHPTQRLYFLLNKDMNIQTFNLLKLKNK